MFAVLQEPQKGLTFPWAALQGIGYLVLTKNYLAISKRTTRGAVKSGELRLTGMKS